MVTAQNIILLLKISLVTAQVLQIIIGFFYRSCNYSYRSNNNFPNLFENIPFRTQSQT